MKFDDEVKARKVTKHEQAFSMPKDDDYELREEYDLAQLPILPKGRYAPERRIRRNIAVLEPDVTQAFPDDAAVNNALRLVLQLAHIPQKTAA